MLKVKNTRSEDIVQVEFHSAVLQVSVLQQAASIFLEQTFLNASAVPVESIFTFPIPPQSAITSFEALVGEKVSLYLSTSPTSLALPSPLFCPLISPTMFSIDQHS